MFRIARRIVASDARTIGLLPVNDHIAVPDHALSLGRVVAELCGEEVVLVDAGVGGSRHYEASGPMGDGVRVLRPALSMQEADLVGIFEALATEERCVLIDLTGYRQRGVLAWILRSLQGVLLLARAGQVTDSELLAASRGIPSGLWSGVVLLSTPAQPDKALD